MNFRPLMNIMDEGGCETNSTPQPLEGIELNRVKRRSLLNGAEAQNRTADTRLFRPLLYQLSYLGIVRTYCGRTIK